MNETVDRIRHSATALFRPAVHVSPFPCSVSLASFLALSFPLMTASLAQSAVLIVPTQYPSIQAAIDAASEGSTVLVEPGVYIENIDFLGKAITVASISGPAVTIIDGGGIGSVVTFRRSESSQAVLEGFTIRNGTGTMVGGTTPTGGGIYCENASPTIRSDRVIGNQAADSGGGIACRVEAHPIIEGNEIVGNQAYVYGAGISCDEGSSPTIAGNFISHNIGGRGSGIAVRGSSHPLIEGNVIQSNGVRDCIACQGGGVFTTESSSPTIAANVIQGNIADEGGGILCAYGSDPLIFDNAILDNVADFGDIGYGGGVRSMEGASPVLMENTISGNRARWFGGGVHCETGSPLIRANTLTGNESAAEPGICCVKSTPEVIGNILRENKASQSDVYASASIYSSRNVSPEIADNRVSGDGSGMGVLSWEDDSPIINGNRIERCTYAGIRITSSPNTVIDSNFVSANSYATGIQVWLTDSATISNNVLTRNFYGYPTGIELYKCSWTLVLNNTIYGNFSYGVRGIRCQECQSIEIANCIVWNPGSPDREEIKGIGCDPMVRYSVVRGGWPGEGNLDMNPMIVAPETDDFHLRIESPCVDAGDGSVAGLPGSDVEGDHRIVDGDLDGIEAVDMGADELRPEIAARFGSVNAGAGDLTCVVLVNGSGGDRRHRTVTLALMSWIDVTLVAPPAGPEPAAFALYAWEGEPDLDTITPQPFRLGVMGFPTPLQPGSPEPMMIWNNLGHEPKLGAPGLPSEPAPTTVFSHQARHRGTVTLQGFIEDAGSAADGPVSITNAVVVKVVE